jgi:hypothetical protein
MLSLAQALAEGWLDEFIAQAEVNGYGYADRNQFDALVGRITALS